MSVFIDCQCFPGKNSTLIVKEIAFLSLDGTKFDHGLFKPPHEKSNLIPKVRKQVQWLTKNVHGFDWYDGTIDYEELQKCLDRLQTTECNTIYTKGLEKTKFFLRNLPNKEVINLEDLGCPSFKDLKREGKRKISCFYHSPENYMCAVENVHLMFDWYHGHVGVDRMPGANKMSRLLHWCSCC